MDLAEVRWDGSSWVVDKLKKPPAARPRWLWAFYIANRIYQFSLLICRALEISSLSATQASSGGARDNWSCFLGPLCFCELFYSSSLTLARCPPSILVPICHPLVVVLLLLLLIMNGVWLRNSLSLSQSLRSLQCAFQLVFAARRPVCHY